MDFIRRLILDLRLESAAPSHLKDFEAWRCEKCGKLYVDFGDGRPHEVDKLPEGALS